MQIEQSKPIVTETENAELNSLLKRFWNLASIAITPADPQLTPEEKLAWAKVSKSFKFNGELYEVAVSWREERPKLPNNLLIAKKRLVSTERKLMKDKQVAASYQQVLNDYLTKNFIHCVPKNEPKPGYEWFLPHLPVVRSEKETCKVRIVFDGSAPHEGKSLNTKALTGPKLQSLRHCR